MKTPYVEFIVIPALNGKGYAHKNIGMPQRWIVGPGQTCHWYKLKRDAVKAAIELNAAYKKSHTEAIDTFCANLAHAIRNRETVSIGGGTFSPDELRAVLETLKGFEK